MEQAWQPSKVGMPAESKASMDDAQQDFEGE